MSSPKYADQVLTKIYRDATNAIGVEIIGIDAIDGIATAANQATEIASLASIDSKLTNEATAAKQDTGNASLSSMDTKLTSQATAAKQDTGNSSLSSIDGKVSTSAKQDTGNSSLSSIDGKVSTSAKQDTGNTSLNNIDVKVSTAAKQDTGNSSLSSIDGKLNSLGQKIMTGSVPVVLASDQSTLPVIEVDSVKFDAFHRERSSIPRATFNSSHQLSKEVEKWDESITGAGSSTQVANTASVDMTNTAASGDKIIRQTRRAFQYVPGYSRITLMTFVLNAAKTNLRQRVGQFDDDNGVYVELTGSTTNICLRTKISGSAVDTQVAQSAWNYDKFDGNGPSKITLDLTKAQIFFIDLQWLGVGRIRTGFVINGIIYIAHMFNHANLISTVYTTTANWHVRAEIENLGATSGASTLKFMCCSIVIEGGDRDLIGNLRTANTGTTAVTTTKLTRSPIISLRSSVHTVTNRPLKMSMDYLTTDDLLWEIIFNGTITGGSWVASSDYTEKNVSATAISGGTVLDSGYFNANLSVLSFSYNFEDEMNLYLGHNIAMAFDTISLVITPIGKAGSALAAISYKEIY